MQALLNGLAVATVSFVIFTPAQVVADLVFRANTYTATENHVLFSHSFKELPTTSLIRCARLCLNSDTCRSFNHDDTNGRGKCQLNSVQKGDFPADFRPDEGFSYYEPVGAATEGTVPNGVPTTPKTTPEPTPGSTPGPTPGSTPGPTPSSTPDSTLGSTPPPEAERTTLVPMPVLTTVSDCPCCRALGMESGEILDEQITVGSVLNGDDASYGLHLARLNSAGGWCAVEGGSMWIQVDYNRTVDTYAIIAQRHNVSGNYAVYYKISYSDDGSSWTDMRDDETGALRDIIAFGVSSGDSFVSLQTPTETFIRSRFIRIQNGGWLGEFCLRFELIGC